jgi:hypothetical protein
MYVCHNANCFILSNSPVGGSARVPVAIWPILCRWGNPPKNPNKLKVDIIAEYNVVYFEYEADATSISIYFNAIYHIDISTLNSIAYTAIKRNSV